MKVKNFASSPRPFPFSPKLLTVAVYCACMASVAAQAVTGPIDPVTVPKYVIPLVIPPEMPRSGTTEACPPTAKCPHADYNIAVRQFQQQILPGGVWNAVNGRNDGFAPTTVWSYGPAGDPIPKGLTVGTVTVPPGVAPVPAAQSSFNYPAFTVENQSQQTNTVRWINELVSIDPATGYPYTLKDPRRTSVPHLTAIDRTLHWANPEKLPCADPTTGTMLPGATNCRPYVDPLTPDARLGQSYDGPVPMVVHVHGAEVNPYSDGFPEAWWLAAGNDPKTGSPIGQTYATRGGRYDQAPDFRNNSYPGSAVFSYENTQPATTLWYHDHTLGMTANNVYAGPAGFWLIRGEYIAPDGTRIYEQPARGHLPGESNVFQRPTNPKIKYDGKPGCDPNFDAVCRSKIREIPIALQDRSFNSDGSLFYPQSRAYFDGGFPVSYLPNADSDIAPIHQPEFFGNMIVVNGTVWPTFDVVQQRYRLRLLAGADARTFNLSMFAMPKGTVLPDPTLAKYAYDPILNPNAYKNYWKDYRATPGVYEIPFYQIGAEQGFLPKVVKVMTGTAVQLPGNGTEPAATCTPASATTVASNPADPGCNRALLIAPAERADVIVDFTDIPVGTQVRVVNTGPDVPFNDGWAPADDANPVGTGQVMEFKVGASNASTQSDDSSPASRLVLSSEPANTAPITATRRAALIENDSKKLCVRVDATGALSIAASYTTPTDTATACGLLTPPAIPFGPTETYVGTMVGGVPQSQPWAASITEAPTKGDNELFELYNYTVDAHPMHLHGARMQVVSREPLVLDSATGLPKIPAALDGSGPQPPAATETGYKDIVIAEPGMVTRIKAKFQIPGLYVWHCHIVEHEDSEMMVPVCIKGSASDTACNAAPGGTPWPIVNAGKGLTY